MTEVKKDNTMLIVGINLAVMFVYTALVKIISGRNGEGFIGLAFLLAIHFVICLLIAPFINGKSFLLSALMVLLIGVSTCFLVYS